MLSLTINSGIYYILSKPKKTFEKNSELEDFLPKNEKELLEKQRE